MSAAPDQPAVAGDRGDGDRQPAEVAAPLVVTWRRPNPYGYPASTESASTIAAPLLAGFALTLLAQVIDAGRAGVRWPDAALACLTVAITLLLAAVQCGFWARQYFVTPAELEDWWPDLERRWENVRADQWGHERVHRIWAGRFRVAYRCGILALLIAVVVVLLPPPAVHASPFRVAAILVAVGGAIGELAWIVAGWLIESPERAAARKSEKKLEDAIAQLEGELDTLREVAGERAPQGPGPGDTIKAKEARLALLRSARYEKEQIEAAAVRAAHERREAAESLRRPIRPLVRLALRISRAVIPEVTPVRPPKAAPLPSQQRGASGSESGPMALEMSDAQRVTITIGRHARR